MVGRFLRNRPVVRSESTPYLSVVKKEWDEGDLRQLVPLTKQLPRQFRFFAILTETSRMLRTISCDNK